MSPVKVVVDLTSGRDEPERVTIAFPVATAAQAAGHDTLAFFTMEAVRLGFPGGPESIPQQEGRPSFTELWSQFRDAGGVVYL